jgi:hypothetical protein
MLISPPSPIFQRCSRDANTHDFAPSSHRDAHTATNIQFFAREGFLATLTLLLAYRRLSNEVFPSQLDIIEEQDKEPGIRRAFSISSKNARRFFRRARKGCPVPHPSHREGWDCEGVVKGETIPTQCGFSGTLNIGI